MATLLRQFVLYMWWVSPANSLFSKSWEDPTALPGLDVVFAWRTIGGERSLTSYTRLGYTDDNNKSFLVPRKRERERELSGSRRWERESCRRDLNYRSSRSPSLSRDFLPVFPFLYYRCARKRARKKNRIWCDWDHLHRGKTDHARKRRRKIQKKKRIWDSDRVFTRLLQSSMVVLQ